MNARALIGQSAMVYCASKTHGNIACLLNYYIKAIDHTFLWFIGMINHLRCWKNTRRIRKLLTCFSCSSNILRGLSGYKP